jgi:hypothetical protein
MLSAVSSRLSALGYNPARSIISGYPEDVQLRRFIDARNSALVVRSVPAQQFMSPLRLYPLVLGGSAAAMVLGAFYWARSRRKSPDQRELERRVRLSATGRITDGTVLDVREYANNGAAVQLLIYGYDVAGVSYECSQDITHLRQFVDLHSCQLGVPASIKYDPHNPGNSIIVAESWSGLRN